jgi:hypothetical protein
MGLAYLSALLSSWFGPDSVRPVLLAGTFVSEVVVALAILAESKFDTCKGWVVAISMVAGISVGVYCTVALFTYDESISLAQQDTIEGQQSKIIALETRIAQRELSSDTIAKLRAAIAAVPTSVPRKVVFSYLIGDNDSAYLAYEIGRYFIGDKTRWDLSIEVRLYITTLFWGVKVFGPDNSTTLAVREIFRAADIPFSKEEMPPGFMSFGHQPLPDDTVIFIAPKQPAISEAEAVRAEGSK